MKKNKATKTIGIVFLALMTLITLLPTVFMNLEKDAISEIDNRKLTENPFVGEVNYSELPKTMKAFYTDRLGFRNEMILSYTVANDVLFDEMVHPDYMYGKHGNVFFKAQSMPAYSEYHSSFVQMIYKIQNYCEENGTPFVFVFEPLKSSVYPEELPNGWRYDNSWVDRFVKELDQYDICYVDNTETMVTEKEKGEQVFNVKYDAGHWNDLGAFYGMNAAIRKLNEQGMNVRENTFDDFIISQDLKKTLLVSEFPIHEYVPKFEGRLTIQDISQDYKDRIKLNDTYNAFYFYRNEQRLKEGAPRVLAFTGSYINVYGKKFLSNSFGEYIGIHSYQNIFDFAEYYEKFHPDCVIIDAAEFSLLEDYEEYYDFEKMRDFSLNGQTY